MMAGAVLGLLFTTDLVKYTSYLSRTHELTPGFLFFILCSDVIAVLVVTNICGTFFKVSSSILKFFILSLAAAGLFWVGELFLIIEIKSGKTLHHLLAALILLNKYVVFFLGGIIYNLGIFDITKAEREKIFLKYGDSGLKKYIPGYFFSLSARLYNPVWAAVMSIILLAGIDFMLLHLYENSVLFYTGVLLSGMLTVFLLLMTVHQAIVIFRVYDQYDRKQSGPDRQKSRTSYRGAVVH
jgi:hypothetical protein